MAEMGGGGESFGGDGALSPWLGGRGCVLGILPGFLLFDGNNQLSPLWTVADDESRVGQGHISLCLRVGAEVGLADLVSLSKVGDFVPFGSHGRLAWKGPCRRRRCLRTVGFWRRDWGGFRSGGGGAKLARLGRGPAIDDA